MKVILLEDIRGVGRKDEVKNVSDGYARNFLLPRGKAEPAAPDALRRLESREQTRKKTKEEAKENLVRLAKEKFVFQLKTGSKGETYGSIGKEEIEKALAEKGYPDAEIELKHPIKTLGENKVAVSFGWGIGGEISISVEPQQP
jgi:large subunit ribosomal protein L9